MAAPALVQSNGVATSVNSPASITASLASASTAGNLLILAVTVTGATPSISTPAGWTLINSSGNASIAGALFILPRNAGGITTVVVTLTNATNGGAAASMFEFSNVNANPPPQEFVQSFALTSSAFPFTGSVSQVQQLSELSFFTCGFQATTTLLGAGTGGDYSGNTAGATSTVATTNVTIVNLFAINAGSGTPTQGGGGISPGISLNAAVASAVEFARLALGAGLTIGHGAGESVFVGQSLNPAGSLQTPQPIAPGNFFSGTTGSF